MLLLLAKEWESRRCSLSYVTHGAARAAGLPVVEQTGAAVPAQEPLKACMTPHQRPPDTIFPSKLTAGILKCKQVQ